MNWLRDWLPGWRRGIRQVAIISLDGLKSAQVDVYLNHGLLPNLALLSDIGGRYPWVDSQPFDPGTLAAAFTRRGVKVELSPPTRVTQRATLETITVDDRAQQELLIATLDRGRLIALYGRSPTENERLVIRDVHARMDEVVGKAFSFVQGESVLIAVTPGLIFASRPLGEFAATAAGLAAEVLRILGVESRDA